MSDGNQALFAVIGAAVIGYIGSESAPISYFERLLWPQRFYTSVTLKDAVFIALFMPMGGPLYKASLEAFDKVHASGILKSVRVVIMLGTPFLGDTGLRQKVTQVSDKDGEPPEVWENQARQTLWTCFSNALPVPEVKPIDKGSERGAASQRHIVRQETCVDHVSFTPIQKPPSNAIVVEDENRTVRAPQVALIFLSEATAIFSTILTISVWRSWFGLKFLAPLVLKLISAGFAIRRESLICRPKAVAETDQNKSPSFDRRLEFDASFCTITIAMPSRGMLVLSGPYACTHQFSRHYGHPIRSRAREWAQLCCIFGFGLLFPAGLVLSSAYMPPPVQYYWIGYQLYTCFAMYVYRYFGGHECGSFATRLARICQRVDAKSSAPTTIVMKNEDGEYLAVEVSTTWHAGWKEAKDAAYGLSDRLIKPHQDSPPPKPRMRRRGHGYAAT